jgi:SAM-dependent methyltransferase
MAADDPASPEFWSVRYEAGKTPWDLHGVPAALQKFLERSTTRGAVLIPGCGSGYEIRTFHEAGYEVTAVDFSSAAIQRARSVLGPLARNVHLGDFFTHDFGSERFGLIYERTFLCALTPPRWPEYAARMAELLDVGGALVGTFVHGQAQDGPPFPMPEGREKELFAEKFERTRSEPLPPSLPVFEGMEERWQEWKRID